MAMGNNLRPSHPKTLFIWFALHATEALWVPSHLPSLFNTPQFAARGEAVVSLEPYTGDGAV